MNVAGDFCVPNSFQGLENTNCSDLHVLGSGLGIKERHGKQDIYGPNTIEVQVKPVTHLIIYEVTESKLNIEENIGQIIGVEFVSQTPVAWAPCSFGFCVCVCGFFFSFEFSKSTKFLFRH